MLINGVKYLEVEFGNAFNKSNLIKSMKADKDITFLLNTETNIIVPARLDEYNECHVVIKARTDTQEHHYYGTIEYITEVITSVDFKSVKRAYVRGKEIFWKEYTDLVLGLRALPTKQLPILVSFKLPTYTTASHYEFNSVRDAIEWLQRWNWRKGDLLEVRRGKYVVVFYSTLDEFLARIKTTLGE